MRCLCVVCCVVLRTKGWATQLVAGVPDDGFSHNSACGLCSVSVTVTDLGLSHIEDVVTHIYHYIATLIAEGPQVRVSTSTYI